MSSYILNLNKVELSDLDDIISSHYFPIRDTTIKGKRFINFMHIRTRNRVAEEPNRWWLVDLRIC